MNEQIVGLILQAGAFGVLIFVLWSQHQLSVKLVDTFAPILQMCMDHSKEVNDAVTELRTEIEMQQVYASRTQDDRE